MKFVFSPDVNLWNWLGSKHQLTNKNNKKSYPLIWHAHNSSTIFTLWYNVGNARRLFTSIRCIRPTARLYLSDCCRSFPLVLSWGLSLSSKTTLSSIKIQTFSLMYPFRRKCRRIFSVCLFPCDTRFTTLFLWNVWSDGFCWSELLPQFVFGTDRNVWLLLLMLR